MYIYTTIKLKNPNSVFFIICVRISLTNKFNVKASQKADCLSNHKAPIRQHAINRNENPLLFGVRLGRKLHS